MSRIVVNQKKVGNIQEAIDICPFGAIEEKDGKVIINENCRICSICVNQGPPDAFKLVEKEVEKIDKTKWAGVAICVDHYDGKIHPVSYELIGKAKELASVNNQPVYALFIGSNIEKEAEELLYYGVDKVYTYDYEEFKNFRIEPYASAFYDFIENVKPSSILVGSTTVGRQLAPRVAARMRTGLTADCTFLEMKENTDLVQIRPAFGGNIMARIVTPNHRPQLATVRYKVMDPAKRMENKSGDIIKCEINREKLKTNVEVLETNKKEAVKSIDQAEILVVAGRGVRQESDLEKLYKLADILGGELACTRPLVENGWMKNNRQIGLSGRTVRPKLIITFGVSGAVQFTAGMNQSDMIIAIDQDENAPIFDVAHFGLVGDMNEIVEGLLEKIEQGKGA